MAAMASWECFLCGKTNAESAAVCGCCGRDRAYAPMSTMNATRAKPLALHGLAVGQHEIRSELVQTLVMHGLDLGAIDSDGWTALHCAAKLGQSHAIRAILSAGTVDGLVEAKTASGGWRALHFAVHGGHRSVVEELLLADAAVDARLETAEAPTPLLLAAAKRDASIVDLLLQCGADATATTRNLRRTALHIAGMSAVDDAGCWRLLVV